MIRAILVDDEISSTDILHWLLETYCKQVEVLCECHNPDDAILKIKEMKPDLVFLDIEMPGMNAFEMIAQLKPINFEIIFVTAYNQFALQAFKENAVDYLLKPVEKSELMAAVEKLSQKQKNENNQKLDALLKVFQSQLMSSKKIALPSNEGIIFINVDQIVRCESDSNYSFIILTTGEKTIITKTLKQIEESLSGYPFYRVHQSHLVNLNHIVKFSKDGGGYLVMSDKSTITVARQRKDGLMELFSKL